MFWASWRKRHLQNPVKQREDELRRLIFAGEARQSDGARRAIMFCEYCITHYEGWFEYNEKKWHLWQRTVIVGGVVATLAGVITIPPEWLTWLPHPELFAWVRGVPAGIVTIAAGFLTSFTYREDAVRHELTSSMLWNELVRFVTRAEPYNRATEEEDTSLFTNTVCKLVEKELHSWSALVTSNRGSDGVALLPHRPATSPPENAAPRAD